MQKLSILAGIIPQFYADKSVFRSVVYGSDHDDVFDLQCGLDGSMTLSVEDYPLAGNRNAFFDGFSAGNCTEGNGGLEVSQTGTSYVLTMDNNCGVADASDPNEVSSSVGVSMHGYHENDSGFKFYQTTVGLNAACNLKTTGRLKCINMKKVRKIVLNTQIIFQLFLVVF